MTKTSDSGDKTIRVERRKTLSVKGGGGTVRQSFSGGRSKSVVVETKRRRFAKSEQQEPAEPKARAAEVKPRTSKPAAPKSEPRTGGSRGAIVLRSLTEGERDARVQALASARVREAEERERAVEEARQRAEQEEELRREREAAAARQSEEEARKKAEDEQKNKAEEEAASRLAPADFVPPPDLDDGDRDESKKALRTVSRPKKPQTERPRRPAGDRRRGKLTVTNALDEDGHQRSLAAVKRRREKQMRQAHGFQQPTEKRVREVTIPETITVQELANRMAERGVDVIRMLMKQDQIVKLADVLDADTAQIVTEEFGHTVKRVSEADVEEGLFGDEDAPEKRVPRPPVVTIMGHVDHGKTSLLDAIRQANVVSGEAGGITQHIGAYQVEKNGHLITFVDTPGHEAFTAMRARGASTTDIVVLVVAADDGVMPQTIEAISHAKAAGVPLIVAINKIDKPGADPNRVRTELLQHEVIVESMSGETLEVEVSALEGTNLDKLLEAIVLQSELLELRADPDRPAEGTVIEARLDRGRGTVATVLVQRGTLRTGDILVAGPEWGRVRALVDEQGQQLSEAGPSKPVEVLGFQGTPGAGDMFAVVDSEARAREVTDYRQRLVREKSAVKSTGQRGSLEQMMNRLQTEGSQEFALVLKGDVQGSIEAIAGALEKISTDEVKARIIHSGVGGITESDVSLAAASQAAIIGFNVRANKQARDAAGRDGIEIRYYNIIYDLIDDVKAAMSGLLSPERRETFIGNAEILEVFNITKVGKVAGCRVTEGKVERGAGVRLIRDDVVIHEGTLSTLKRFKDEVAEVNAGQECGMAFEKYQDMRVGDVIECFRVEEVQRQL